MILLGLAPGLAAAQVPPSPLSLEEAVGLAVRQNPRLAAASREILAAQAGVRAARVLPNPNVTFTPAITPDGSDEELLLQQPLELNGTRSARRGIAQAQLRRTQAEAIVALRDLVLNTKTAYHELARAQELRSLAQDLLRTTEEFHRGVRRQAEEGLRPEIDPVQTEIEVSRSRQQLILAESQVTIAQAALNTLLGRSPAEPVAAQPLLVNAGASSGDPAFTKPIDRELAIRQALASRTEIAVEEAQGEAFRQAGRLARSEGRPDLVPQLRAGSVTRGFSDYGVGVGISLPFLDYGSRRNRVRQAEVSAQAQAARVAATQNQVRQEVTQAVVRLEAATNVVRQYQQGVLSQARRLLDASLRALQLGAPGASLLNVLEAQRTYRGVVTEYTAAMASYAQAQAELERATGAVPAALLPQPGGNAKDPARNLK
jgi:cobalt-zinc-cadmium efflux system outer membrane protein